jgi:hypothetical protein
MKTEKQVEDELKRAEKKYKETNARFDKYDNHDDLEELGKLEREVDTLKWVLE